MAELVRIVSPIRCPNQIEASAGSCAFISRRSSASLWTYTAIVGAPVCLSRRTSPQTWICELREREEQYRDGTRAKRRARRTGTGHPGCVDARGSEQRQARLAGEREDAFVQPRTIRSREPAPVLAPRPARR